MQSNSLKGQNHTKLQSVRNKNLVKNTNEKQRKINFNGEMPRTKSYITRAPSTVL